MTHEGARSIYGAYLNLLGAFAATIWFVTGLGEFLGYSLRLFTGIIADRSKKYWTITFIGYVVNMVEIPALALILQNGWIYACILIVVERIGKAIRHLVYAGAMLVDAFAALLFGWLYDRFGLRVLVASSAISACFSIFVFGLNTLAGTIIGITMWGVGMGAQESVLKSAITTIVSKNNRSSGFGLFETAFGVFWFIGSWIMGLLYDFSPVYLIVFSVVTQALSIPIFYFSYRVSKNMPLMKCN